MKFKKDITAFKLSKMKIDDPDLTLIQCVELYFVLNIKKRLNNSDFDIVNFFCSKKEEDIYTFEMEIDIKNNNYN